MKFLLLISNHRKYIYNHGLIIFACYINYINYIALIHVYISIIITSKNVFLLKCFCSGTYHFGN